MLRFMFLAGCGGFIGTCLRYLAGRGMQALGLTAWPVATLTVNLVGCFLIGLLLGLADRHHLISTAESAILVTGFCGGLTTFSTFAADIWSLGERNEWIAAALYICTSMILGILLVGLGRYIVK